MKVQKSTEATDDRLKNGCNINKSFLVLVNVINILADKAIGKKKIFYLLIVIKL